MLLLYYYTNIVLCAALPRVQALDHANPWERLRVTPKSCSFTSRSSIRPSQPMARITRHADILEKMKKCPILPRVQAFNHANPWEGLRVTPIFWKKCATLPRVPVFDHANPWEGLRVTPKIYNFTSRSCVRPHQSMGKVASHIDKIEKICNCTSRSSVRARQSMGRATRHTDILEKMKKYPTLPRVPIFDHVNP